MKLWSKTKEYSEGKYLVVRRDGTIPAWPHFVIGARDPAATAALCAYADEAQRLGMSRDYSDSVRDLADEFARYWTEHGMGDPESGPHRKDDHVVVDLMGGRRDSGMVMLVREGEGQHPKPPTTGSGVRQARPDWISEALAGQSDSAAERNKAIAEFVRVATDVLRRFLPGGRDAD